MPTDNNFHKSSNNHIKVNTAEFSRHLDVQIKPKTTCGPHMPTAVAIRIQSSPSSFFLKFSLNRLNTSLLENPSKNYCHRAVHLYSMTTCHNHIPILLYMYCTYVVLTVVENSDVYHKNYVKYVKKFVII